MGCNHEETPCDCGGKCNCDTPLERVRYFNRQPLTADDMRAEQEYFLEKERRHNRMLHGRGVVCGLLVSQVTDQDASPTSVVICPGYALSPCGNEIAVSKPVTYDLADCLAKEPNSCEETLTSLEDNTPKRIYIAIRYKACPNRPVRTMPAGCGCDETSCEHSRIRDGFEIKCLTELPESHKLPCPHNADKASSLKSAAFKTLMVKNPDSQGEAELPESFVNLMSLLFGDCPPCPKDDWVVLAEVRFVKEKLTINNKIRRWVVNPTSLMEKLYCLSAK